MAQLRGIILFEGNRRNGLHSVSARFGEYFVRAIVRRIASRRAVTAPPSAQLSPQTEEYPEFKSGSIDRDLSLAEI